MRLVLTGRHLDISPGLRRLVDGRIARLDRLLGESAVSAQVILSLEKARHSVEMTVHVRGDHMLSGRATGAAWPGALAGACVKLERQAERLKGKWADRKRQGSQLRVAVSPAATTAQPASPRIVRLTRARFKPMSIQTATIELAASGDPYLLFRNVETDGLSVLLRGRAGEFQLVEPER